MSAKYNRKTIKELKNSPFPITANPWISEPDKTFAENVYFIVNDPLIGPFWASIFKGKFMPFRSTTGRLTGELYMRLGEKQEQVSLKNIIIAVLEEEMNSRLMSPEELAKTDFVQEFITERPLIAYNTTILNAIDDHFFNTHGPILKSAHNYPNEGDTITDHKTVSKSFFFTMKLVPTQVPIDPVPNQPAKSQDLLDTLALLKNVYEAKIQQRESELRLNAL